MRSVRGHRSGVTEPAPACPAAAPVCVYYGAANLLGLRKAWHAQQ
jgi:hypothetical protein